MGQPEPRRQMDHQGQTSFRRCHRRAAKDLLLGVGELRTDADFTDQPDARPVRPDALICLGDKLLRDVPLRHVGQIGGM